MRCIRGLVVLSVAYLFALAAPGAAMAQQGGLRYSVSVAGFSNESSWRGQMDIGHELAIVLTNVLRESDRFIVVGEAPMRSLALEEQDLAASGRAAAGDGRAPATGHLTPAQLLVRGAVTHVQHETASDAGSFEVAGLQLGGQRLRAEINVTFAMVDSTTGQVVASRSVVGASSTRGLRFRFRRDGKETAMSSTRDDNLQSALEAAAEQAVAWMAERLDSLPWQGSVVRVDGQTVYVNRGAREGMRPGVELLVGPLEVIRDPGTGEVLGQLLAEEVARLEVQQVLEKLSLCRVVTGDLGAIREGVAVTLPSHP